MVSSLKNTLVVSQGGWSSERRGTQRSTMNHDELDSMLEEVYTKKDSPPPGMPPPEVLVHTHILLFTLQFHAVIRDCPSIPPPLSLCSVPCSLQRLLLLRTRLW